MQKDKLTFSREVFKLNSKLLLSVTMKQTKKVTQKVVNVNGKFGNNL
jgi:hypothetical protein